MDMTSSTSIVIIGAGPAGLIAAERLSAAGHPVDLYDRMPMPGRKFLMAGRGGLNLTHSEPLDHFIARYADAASFLSPYSDRFPPQALRAWSRDLGEDSFVGSSGRIFPKSFKASPLLRAWIRRLETRNVTFHMRHKWIGWSNTRDLIFETNGKQKKTVAAACVLLALGGASWPRLGADGSWQIILRDKGIKIQPLTASNVGIRVRWSPLMRERFAGSPLKRLRLSCDTSQAVGEAVITEEGLEGGAIYALGAALRASLAQSGSAILIMDLRRDLSESELTTRLSKPRGKKSLSSFLANAAGLDPAIIALLRESFMQRGETLPEDIPALARVIKNCPLRIEGMNGLDRAISSAGGIDRHELDHHLMIKSMPGVFVAGEMIDWDAPTGGYLLQACFATGVAAAEGIMRWCADTSS